MVEQPIRNYQLFRADGEQNGEIRRQTERSHHNTSHKDLPENRSPNSLETNGFRPSINRPSNLKIPASNFQHPNHLFTP